MKTPLLFQEPLTAEQAHQLRKRLAKAPQPAPQKPSIFQRLSAQFAHSPLKIGLLLYANALALLILLRALLS